MSNGAQRLLPRWVAMTALAVGIAGGGYGIASAANGSSNNSSSGGAASTAATPSAPASMGKQRSDETPLTGDALAKVTAAAKAKVPGGQVIRIETDADGNAAYEAHMTDANGAPVTVYVSKDYATVSVELR